MILTYILDKDRNPVQEPDILKFGQWFEEIENRRVALTEFEGLRVSTVFLGVVHGFTKERAPILFETMVFRGDKGIDEARCTTWGEAEEIHQKMVEHWQEQLFGPQPLRPE